jgi:hypothetical protein
MTRSVPVADATRGAVFGVGEAVLFGQLAIVQTTVLAELGFGFGAAMLGFPFGQLAIVQTTVPTVLAFGSGAAMRGLPFGLALKMLLDEGQRPRQLQNILVSRIVAIMRNRMMVSRSAYVCVLECGTRGMQINYYIV